MEGRRVMDYVWRDGQRLTPWMLYCVDRLDVAFFERFGLHLLVSSGVRLDPEQEKLFRDRYRVQAVGNGPYGDVRWWQGKRWVLVSPEGPVAAPGSSNHQLQKQRDGSITAAVDLRDTGDDAGVMTAGTVRANWLRANASKFGLVASGYGFNPKEPWHNDIPHADRTPPARPASVDANPAGSPDIPDAPERNEDMARNSGVLWTEDGGKTTMYMVFNAESGWDHTYTRGKGSGPMDSAYNDALAKALDTPPWATITKAHADVIRAANAATRKVSGSLEIATIG